MKQKIEWYKEVLELEPGSRVFFPLAKLLEADSQTSEAVATLQQGVSRHPDHIEARLLLIELLAKKDDQDAVARELSSLGDLFCRYPSFWTIWSNHLAKDPLMQDAALALRFFAAALTGKNITWASVIEQGLSASLKNSEAAGTDISSRGTVAEAHTPPVPRKVTITVTPVSPHAPVKAEPAPLDPLITNDMIKTGDFESDEEPEEPFSLRTRSMADVLAEQGDIPGALDIYQELLAAAESDDDRKELTERIDHLSSKGSTGDVPAEDAEPSSGDNTRLVTLLESLAQRLESRAR